MRTPNRWSPETVERASETRAWMDAEVLAGRPVGEDEVWSFVTTRWPGIATGSAELVLNVAMAAVPARGGAALRSALTEAFRGICDGTYADDPAAWTLELGREDGLTVAGLIDLLSREIPVRLAGREPEEDAAGPSGPAH